MSKQHEDKQRLATEDRAAIREEIATGEKAGAGLRAFDMLAKQADEADVDAPPMPDALREKLVEKFGAPEPERTRETAPARALPVESKPGFFAQLRDLFAGNGLAYGGGLAVAACALLLVVFLPRGGNETGGGPVDTLRGGATTPEAGAEATIYLFPEDKAAPVVAMMNPERPATVCRDAADFAARLAEDKAALAVAVDLDERTVVTYRAGEPVEESAIESDGATDVLLEVRAASDAIATPAE